MNAKSFSLLVIVGLLMHSFAVAAIADGDPTPKKRARRHHAAQAAPISEDEQLARDYRARRRAGDNRNCPCAGNPGEYCSCDSYRGYGYGYGYGYYGDRYGTNAGWSRGYGHSSDIPSSGYTGTYTR